MTRSLRLLIIAATLAVPAAASAQTYRGRVYEPEATGSFYRLTPPDPYGYDTGSDMDRHPERPAYQQGGGQQTGGPARNLIPGDNLHFFPR